MLRTITPEQPNTAGKPPPTRSTSVMLPMLMVLAIGLTTIAGLTVYGTLTLNDFARTETKGRLETALKIEAQRLKNLVEEYTSWDEAYRNLVGNPSPSWAANYGRYVGTELGVDLTLAANGRDETVFAFRNGEIEQFALTPLFESGLRPAVRAQRQGEALNGAYSGFLNLEGADYLVALKAFTPQNEAYQPPDGSFLLAARQVSGQYLQDIGKVYGIPGLHRAALETTDGIGGFAVLGPYGDPLFQLRWDDPAHTIAKSRTVLMAVIGVALLMIVLTVWIVRNDSRRQQQYIYMLHAMAHLDPLTRISNRRDFYSRANRELNRAVRHRRPMTLLLLDIDNFKHINDAYGHVVGDTILTKLVKQLSSQLRDFDLLARLGGDEFAAILPDTPLKEGREAAERLRRSVEGLTHLSDGLGAAITVSVGIAQLSGGESLDELLGRADKALYNAKNQGRNRCIVA